MEGVEPLPIRELLYRQPAGTAGFHRPSLGCLSELCCIFLTDRKQMEPGVVLKPTVFRLPSECTGLYASRAVAERLVFETNTLRYAEFSKLASAPAELRAPFSYLWRRGENSNPWRLPPSTRFQRVPAIPASYPSAILSGQPSN